MYCFVLITQYLLCTVSTLLTALFCVEISQSSVSGYYSLIALVVVGVGFELSKYIFFYYQQRSVAYVIVSMLLVVFSWSASVAFFVANEKSNLDSARVKTREYKDKIARIESIKRQIHYKVSMVDQRLSSSYHAQWDKANDLLQDIRDDETLLSQEQYAADSAGRESSYRAIGTSALFLSLSTLLDVSITTVTLLSYSVLALLLECCSLGTISLTKSLRVKTKQIRVDNKPSAVNADKCKQTKIHEKMACLRTDIVSGRIDPVIRKIRKSGYRLSENNIRAVLLELKDEGVLINGPKNLILLQK